MVVNPDKTIATIELLLKKIDNISKKEYDDDKIVGEFGELVIEVQSLVRNSGIKNLKEQDWYSDYCEFSGWTRKGVPHHYWEESFEESELRKSTVGKRYDFDIEKLRNILYGCKKEFEMIKSLQKDKSYVTRNKKEKKGTLPKIKITLRKLIFGIIASVIAGIILFYLLPYF